MILIMRTALLLLAAFPILAQTPPRTPADELADFIKASYTKYEYRVPMRDGVRLFTSVYLPKDTSKSYPILLNRTPYTVSPYGVDAFKRTLGPSDLYAKEGFIFVYQDVRGRNMSEGEFVNMRPHNPRKGPKDIDESTDTYDTIEWLIKNLSGHNGKVGQYGISYPGFYTSAGMIDAHPALAAASPQAPIADWWANDDFHHNGALFLPHAFLFLASFGRPRPEPTLPDPNNVRRFDMKSPDGYDFSLRTGPLANLNEKYLKNDVAFWNEMLKHPDYDEFWQARNLRPHLKAIKPAVLTVGGWFDAEDLFGALKTYDSVEKQSPGASNRIVMGPWYHGGWARADGDRLGQVMFHQKTSEFYRKEIELPFFNHYLKAKGEMNLPEAYMFETGKNQWRKFDSWPRRDVKPSTLYLHANAKLSFDPPTESSSSFDEYLSDPNKPVPFTPDTADRMTIDYMVDDQRFAFYRPDVLSYETEILEQDVTIAGPVKVTLWVSTTGTDADFIVKLIDVYPNSFTYGATAPARRDPMTYEVKMGGFQQLVRGEPFRGRYRNNPSKPEPFVPGTPARIEFEMPDMLHTFRQGHRIMVQIQSSWFPLIDRNPQTFVDIPNAKASDFRRAMHRVYRSGANVSGIQLQVLPR
jgi:putative CocE/NonD family hydrolase